MAGRDVPVAVASSPARHGRVPSSCTTCRLVGSARALNSMAASPLVGRDRSAPPGPCVPRESIVNAAVICCQALYGARWSGWYGGDGGLGGTSENVVAWVRLGRDRAEPARLVVLERLDQLVPGVHHERAVGRDRLPDRLTAQQQQVEVLARALLALGRAERDRAARPEDSELPGPHRAPLGTHGAVPGQDVP